MSLQHVSAKRTLSLLGIGIMALASILPMLVSNRADAAQLTTRSITLSTSQISTAATYAASFNVSASTNIRGIVVDLCSNSPLVGSACTAALAAASSPTSGTVNVSDNTGTTQLNVAFTVHASSVNTGRLLLTHATGLTSLAANDNITLSFTATNPSSVGTYYARIITTSTEAATSGYVPTNGTSTTNYIDYGGIALSTARQLTVNARVQEQLEFCVAAIAGTIDTDGEVPANCGAMPTATEVNIGVVDNTTPVAGTKGLSPVPAANGGNDTNGGVMVRTNAVGGAVISYRAEQNTSSGQLKVAGQTCSGTSSTDQCFNNASDEDFTLAAERFGMAVSGTYEVTGALTDSLVAVGVYDNAGAVPANGFSWVSTGTATNFLNTGGTVSDYELAVVRFAARAAATTPTGAYTVTSTYIATATF